LGIVTSAAALHSALQRFLVFFHAGPFLDGDDDVGTALAEPFKLSLSVPPGS
jgi:hypothetical protein